MATTSWQLPNILVALIEVPCTLMIVHIRNGLETLVQTTLDSQYGRILDAHKRNAGLVAKFAR